MKLQQAQILYGIYDVKPNTSEHMIRTDLVTAIEAGLQWLQIRDKKYQKNLWPLWREINDLMASQQRQLIINDQIDLVDYLLTHQQNSQLQRPGIHLGQGDMSLVSARAQLPSDTIIGITCHNSLELAEQALAQSASYVAFGRFFSSKTKPGPGYADIQTIFKCKELLAMRIQTNPQQAKAKIAVIGGISADTITPLLQTPADLFAVSHDIWGGSKPIPQAIMALHKHLNSL